MFLLNREEIWCAVGTDGWLVARHSEPPTCDPMERRCDLRAPSVGQGKRMGGLSNTQWCDMVESGNGCGGAWARIGR
jgi:hypothetical protein